MRIVFIGTGEIGVPVLQWLLRSNEHQLVAVVTQPDKPAGRAQQLQAPPIKLALTEVAIPILQPRRIKHEDAVAEIRAQQPEVIVVMAYGQILPASVLQIPRVACLNLHASLLPRHRGAAPIQAAIVAGDRETGLTVMYMDEGLDTGDILAQAAIAISPNETGGSLHDRLAQLAPSALADALEQLAAGNAPRFPQNNAEATYAAKLERDDGRIDWSEASQVIARKIRAFDPWPGAFTILREQSGRERKLKIFRASVCASSAPAGQVVVSSDGHLTIGAVRIEEVQLEGKRRMNSADFIRGHPWLGSDELA